ncbi:membrane protein insertase YidC [Coxiella endosymbiont of Amblyomma nuttalli]|uniref:membrane protein insertase YidC n=1 Tax=Coxiella endosymbiont of Amblyomma nuttalli TaxID=2749996 RepID=UPI001BA8350C|nr:membrane protein insertase YidC [Coxiella endosymbiont of Amblyomma nuttalli]QTS83564.1 Membrane protein insertase YidC [Coxiella endosymbiont of Amblyomma nuttalli]
MDTKKIILYIIVALLAVLLFNAWMRDYQMVSSSSRLVDGKVNGKETTYIPPALVLGTTSKIRAIGGELAAGNKTLLRRLITVKTNVLEVEIDTQDGNIISAKLLKYPVSLEKRDTPVQILNANSDELYVAQSGLTNTNTNQEPPSIKFTFTKKKYFKSGETEFVVQLTGRIFNGLRIVKTYTFHRNDYIIQLNYKIKNVTSKPWQGNLYTQLIRRQPLAKRHYFYIRSYNGFAISSPQIPYKKVTYESLNDTNINRTSKAGWIAMQQHYFLSAWIPGSAKLTYHYYSHVIPSQNGKQNIYIMGFIGPTINIVPGETASSCATIYIGPEIAQRLKTLASGLERTVDYGWLWPISMLLFWIMNTIHKIVRNWGWSIVVTTILIKIVFYWFSEKSFRSMTRMREMQPRIQALKERYDDDRQALSRATMELYRKEKINPLGGCLPMLIQIPVFIAFYYVIIESVELRQAPFILWIHDLSAKDPYYVLPILMGLSMLAQQRFSSTSPDPTQQKMMWILPVVFTIFFINFPAGLVLYWLINNVVQILQQWYVNKSYVSYTARLKARRVK